MASQPDIPTPWIGTEDLPVHFANAFGVGVGPNAIFLLVGSMVPTDGDGGAPPTFIPVRPIVRLAIAPAAVPGLIGALQEAVEAHKEAQA
jgi:hypothetical protein